MRDVASIRKRRSTRKGQAWLIGTGFMVAVYVAIGFSQTLPRIDPAAEVIEGITQEEQDRRIQEAKPGINIVPQLNDIDRDEECVQLNNIRIEGTSIDPKRDVWLMRKRPVFNAEGVLVSDGILPSGTVEDLVERFGSNCMGVTAINRLIGELTSAYVMQGYVTSRIYIPDQDLSLSELILLAVEGVVEAIPVSTSVKVDPQTGEVDTETLEKALSASESQVSAALATGVGDYLNLRLFEQTIDNLNAVPSTKASLQLIPGERVGGSIVPISLEYEKPWRVTLGANDQGDLNTGELVVTGSFEYDNFLNLNDQIRLDYSGSQDTNAFVFTGKLPAGLHDWKLTGSYSEYRFILNNVSELFGQNASISLRDDRIIDRDADDKHWLYGELSWDGSQRYINGVELTFVSNAVVKSGYRNEMQVAEDRFDRIDHEGKLFWDIYADIDLGKEPGQSIAVDPSPRLVISQTWNQQLAKELSWTSVVTGQIAIAEMRPARQLSLPGVTAGPGSVDSGITFDQKITMRGPFNDITGGEQLGDLNISFSVRGGYGVDSASGEDRWTLGMSADVSWDHDSWTRSLNYVAPIDSSDGNSGDPEFSVSAQYKF